MNILRAIGVLGCSVGLVGTVDAASIGVQDFNGLSDAATFTNDSFATSGTLTNAGSFNADPSLGMTFTTRFENTRGNAGPTGTDSADFIGVNSFTGDSFAMAPDLGPTGTAVGSGVEHNYEFNDGDGLLTLEFDAVEVAGFSDRTLSFYHWISDTSFDDGDRFMAYVTDGVLTHSIFDHAGVSGSDDAIEARVATAEGDWTLVSVDLEALLSAGFGTQLALVIGADVNASAENIYIDNIAFTGTPAPAPVPVPAALWLLGSGLVGLLANHRRRV